MKKYIYIDYENMGNLKELVQIDGKYFFFIGNTQNSIPKTLVLATNNISVEWIPIEGCGKNALDFHIAYYLGQNIKEPDTKHYILSKDQGYDPLISSINKTSKMKIAKRIISLEDLRISEKTEAASEDVEYKALVNRIKGIAKTRRPKSEKTLKTFITGQLFPKMEEEDVKTLIDELYRNKIISKGSNQRLTYN